MSEINFVRLSKALTLGAMAGVGVKLTGADVEALVKTITGMGEEIETLNARIAELEAENNRLAELLHNELSSVEIATDLGNKRWVALNDIYENGEKHNTNWCKRKAQEGLGIKNG